MSELTEQQKRVLETATAKLEGWFGSRDLIKALGNTRGVVSTLQDLESMGFVESSKSAYHSRHWRVRR
jgi:DNA-binding MarR family transcriptional regulator